MSEALSAAMLTVEYHLGQIFKEAMPPGREIDAKMLRLLIRNASPELRRQAQERQSEKLAEAQSNFPYEGQP